MKIGRKISGIALSLMVFTLLGSGTALAVTLTQEFNTEQNLPKGTITSLDSGANSISVTTRDNVNNIYGVVVEQGDVSFNSNRNSNTSVAYSGVVDTLVSNANGPIKSGDIITVDIIEGVGEKAVGNGRVLGIAQNDFDENSEKSKIINSGDQSINIGLIPVKISVSNYSDIAGSGTERNRIESIADGVAGKTVKPFAMVAAGLILIGGAFAATFLLTTSSFGSMISIGRNPFAQKKIVSSLFGLILISVGIFCTSLLVSYFILRVLG